MKKNNTKVKSFVQFVGMLIVIGIAAGIAYYGIGKDNTLGAEHIRLGLDLKGGVNIVYEAALEEPTQEDMDAALEMIQTRLNKENYTEAEASIEGNNRIRVDIPGVEDPQEAVSSIGAAAMLKFYDMQGKEILTGKNVESAQAVAQPDPVTGAQTSAVAIKFDAEGTKIFREYTKASVGQLLTITLDEEIISQATITTEITNGEGVISGSNITPESAKQLADRIEAGSLPFALNAISSDGVGAKLGADSLRTSIEAAIVGFICIMVFMLVVYRANGLAANFALMLYIALVIMVLSFTQSTLTLPGIAGIILSIGMAVDANVIIFTRIKEEIQVGRSVRAAVDAGFDKAFSAILDGNVTTLIAAGVLYAFGTGLIRSFAQTLAIGILVSMFTALIVTRYFVKLFIEMGLQKPQYFVSLKKLG